jgi:hypothetical protein
MTHAEFTDRLRRYTPRAKLGIIAWGVVMLAFWATALVVFARTSDFRTLLLYVSVWIAGTLLGIFIWRRVAYSLASRHGLTCPFCQRSLLGRPAEPHLMESGCCHFCSSEVFTDASRKV